MNHARQEFGLIVYPRRVKNSTDPFAGNFDQTTAGNLGNIFGVRTFDRVVNRKRDFCANRERAFPLRVPCDLSTHERDLILI